MRATEWVDVDAPASAVFPYVADLGRYPAWMRLVHEADVAPTAFGPGSSDAPAWWVEIRAGVGPFTRSKRLRMERTRHEPDRLVEFERREVDGRQHARWALRVDLAPSADRATRVTLHLAYDGRLWTGGLLERALDEEVRRGRAGLATIVAGESTH